MVSKRFGSHSIKLHSSDEIKDLVDTDLRNIECDPPIARNNHILSM